MVTGWVLFLFIAAYLSVLFWVAWYAERREKAGRSIVSNPYVYALSLAVYCSSWTFYGSVGKAATSGLSFLTIYLGPTLMASLWLIILKKVIRIAKENRITTISDFIGTRYGNSLLLAGLVTVVALVGIVPYLGLQIKAIMSTFSILAGASRGSSAAGWFITLILGAFAIIFGARRLDASERHEGLIFAIAFESIVKLAAFLFVGFYVSFVLFGGVHDIFGKISQSEFRNLLFIGGNNGSAISYSEWGSLLFLSMMAIMFLPRQFQVAVVENSNEEHIHKAMWLFPLYLFLINLFVMPVAFGGLLLQGGSANADNFVLMIPLTQKQHLLALFVFIGGFSAATGMIIVESIAISTMVMNNLVMPAIYKFKQMKGFPLVIINARRLVILGVVFMGYFFAVSIGEFYSLVDIGLKSFEAVSIFAPAFLLGLYWKRGNKYGAIAGISAGFLIWCYTLLIPALLRAGIISQNGSLSFIVNSDILNPYALFGLKGLDKWSNSLLWGLLANIGLYVGVSIFTPHKKEEQKQALVFVESYSPSFPSEESVYSIREIEDILGQYIGKREALEIIEFFLARNRKKKQSVTQNDLIKLKNEAKRILSGVLGSSIANIIFEERLTQTEAERGELLDSIKQISYTLRYSRKELEEANRQLAMLKEFSENIIESLPLGVATLDESLHVKYWNRTMEDITGVKKEDALEIDVDVLLGCMEHELFSPEIKQGEVICKMPNRILKAYLTGLTGTQKGYVLLFEDITEKKKIEEELFRTTKHAGIGRLAAGVSHEIGNPLASISSLVQELMSEDSTPFVRESLNTINQHIERIARIVRNLGDFARLYPREKVKTSLNAILEKTINFVRYDKNFRHIEIETNVGPLPLMLIDPDQIQQLFLNLMLNARDAMPGKGKLCISMKPVQGQMEMVFRDSGEGIDPEFKDKIFDPFFTTKGPLRGTGLGLSICYSIIKDHGGTVDVASEKKKGTAFIIRLPIEE